MFKLSPLLLFIFIFNSLSGQEIKIKFFPDSSDVTALLFNPLEPQTYASINIFNTNEIIDYEIYVPFAIGFNKVIACWNKNQISFNSAIHSQFGFRQEDTKYFTGIRKSYLNSDFRFGFEYYFNLSKKLILKTQLLHQSSHLGDDFMLLHVINKHDYWAKDPTNFEMIDLGLIYEFKHFNTYAVIGYVISPETSRKRGQIQFGTFSTNFYRAWLKHVVVGFDLRLLEINNFYPNLNSGIGFKISESYPAFIFLNFYHGHLPYSRFEKEVITSWFGAGINLGSIL